MEENVKNLCAPIPAGLHARVREEQEVSGKTLGQYMAWLIQTFYDNQKEETTMSGDKRTVAFQVPGELFERFKDYLQEKRAKVSVAVYTLYMPLFVNRVRGFAN